MTVVIYRNSCDFGCFSKYSSVPESTQTRTIYGVYSTTIYFFRGYDNHKSGGECFASDRKR